jgi:hypothetical protein
LSSTQTMVLRGRIVESLFLPGVTGLPATAFLSLAPGKGAYAVAQCRGFSNASKRVAKPRAVALWSRLECKDAPSAQGDRTASTSVWARHGFVENRRTALVSAAYDAPHSTPTPHRMAIPSWAATMSEMKNLTRCPGCAAAFRPRGGVKRMGPLPGFSA